MAFELSWYQRNKHLPSTRLLLKSRRLKKRYGIDLKEFNRLSEIQRGLCAICKKDKELHVDHCHASGRIRGLLCHHCNNGLGCFSDNSSLLKEAIKYLK